MSSLFLNTAMVICDLSGLEEHVVRAIFSVAVLFMWFKVFYLLRLFFRTAFLVRMILEIVYDMRWFLFVLLLAVGAFGHSFWLLSENPRSESSTRFVGSNILYALSYSYR